MEEAADSTSKVARGPWAECDRAAAADCRRRSPRAQMPELGAQPTAAAGDGYAVAVLGASGGIGQPLSLLLKL